MKSRPRVPRGTIAPGSIIAAPSARNQSMHRLTLAGRPDFWRLWSVCLVVFTARWLETVAVGVFVYQHSRSAFLVAMMTMLRLLPMSLFGAFIGADGLCAAVPGAGDAARQRFCGRGLKRRAPCSLNSSMHGTVCSKSRWSTRKRWSSVLSPLVFNRRRASLMAPSMQ
jgi:hypothetical protein